MIKLIIFSRKRPMQLDTLLKSMPSWIKPHVIIKFDEDYKQNYYNVLDTYKCAFLEESLFYEDVEHFLTNHYYHMNDSNYVGFCTDDCVFYRTPEEVPYLKDHETFSFRYGLNTTLQDHTRNYYQPSLNLYSDKGYIEWSTNNYQYPLNYAYSLACDGHVYTHNKLLALFKRIHFKNSNELEGKLQSFRHEVNIIKAHKQSSLVCLPINNLSNYTTAGHTYQYSVETLNELFTQNKRINIKKTFENIKIIGSHQELPLIIE